MSTCMTFGLVTLTEEKVACWAASAPSAVRASELLLVKPFPVNTLKVPLALKPPLQLSTWSTPTEQVIVVRAPLPAGRMSGPNPMPTPGVVSSGLWMGLEAVRDQREDRSSGLRL